MNLGNIAECTTAIVAICAFMVALHEYHVHKDEAKAQVLSEYNKRYSEDPCIVKVVKYLNYICKDGKANNPVREMPSNYDIEIFMRFFEELEYQIRAGRLDRKEVNDLFVYYAKLLHDKKELRTLLGVTDYDQEKESWKTYRDLMTKYEP